MGCGLAIITDDAWVSTAAHHENIGLNFAGRNVKEALAVIRDVYPNIESGIPEPCWFVDTLRYWQLARAGHNLCQFSLTYLDYTRERGVNIYYHLYFELYIQPIDFVRINHSKDEGVLGAFHGWTKKRNVLRSPVCRSRPLHGNQGDMKKREHRII